jgi:DNA-binding NarL/FixJ family response regulator
MSGQTLFSIIESSGHPNASALYRSIDIQETQVYSMRKAIAAIKKQAPDFIVAEFFYGYGNNYAGVNISNLDVLLHSMQRYAADTKVIVLVQVDEYKYVEQLNEIIKLHDVLKQPVTPEQLHQALRR